MTEFLLQRGPEVESLGTVGVQGQMQCLVNEKHVFGCLTLEHKDTLCPAGRYRLKNAPMVNHGGVIRPELQDVPGHSGVFFHSGNKAADSLMCPLCGDSRPTPGTLAGGIAHKIADKIVAMVDADPHDSWITILAAE